MSKKKHLLLLFFLAGSYLAIAHPFGLQKNIAITDTAVFFYTNSGLRVSSQVEADFVRVVLPPDTSIDKNLYVIKDYYPNGKIKMFCNSLSNINPILTGNYIEFFANGKRKSTGRYVIDPLLERSSLQGIMTTYYPNGKVLSIRDFFDGGRYKLMECRDSLGIILADKGNGKWIEYEPGYKYISRDGNIINGLEDGEWKERRADSVKYITLYKKGKLQSGSAMLPSGRRFTFTQFNAPATFRRSGMEQYLKNNFHFPESATTNYINNNLTIEFNVDENGALGNVKVIKSIDEKCDKEALRVIKSSAGEWHAALRDGIPCKSQCEVTFNFKSEMKYIKTTSKDLENGDVSNQKLAYYVNVMYTTYIVD